MKKITLILFALFTCWQINAQVAYTYGWEPTGLGNWSTAGTGTFSRNTTTPCLESASVRANVYYDGTNTFTSPLLGVSNGGDVTFSFDYKVTEYSSNTTGAPANQVEIIVQRSSSTSGPWTTVGTINSSNHVVSSSCATKTFTFNQEVGDLYVRFLSKAVGVNSDLYFRYDNIVVSQGAAPSCVSPTGFVASALTASTATIAWNAAVPVPSTGYEYYYSDINTAPTGAGTPINALTDNLSGLDPATTYYVWLRSDCGSGSFSAWNGPFTFTTACVSVTDFVQDFDGITTPAFPVCWKKVGTSGTAYTQTANPNSSPNTLYLYSSATTNLAVVAMQPVSNLGDGTHRLRLDMRANLTVGGVLEFGYLTNPNDASSFVAISSVTASSLSYEQFAITPVAGSYSDYPAFRHTGSPANSLLIDNVIWEPIPSCVEPNTIIASNITSGSVDLSWIDGSGGAQTDYEYAIQAPATGIPAGAGTPITALSVNGESFDINGNALTPNTSYEVYVRSDCGGGDFSPWVGPITFATPCNPYSVPYFEGFESGYAHNTSVAGCLTQSSVTGAGVWTANSTFTDYNRTPRTGSFNAFLVYSNEDWMFIPIDLVGGTSYRVSLYARQDGATAANSNIAISYGTANNNAAMTNAIVAATGIIDGTYQEIVGDFVPATSGTYYVGIKGYMNSSPWYISLDDISITESPSCINPTNIVASNISTNSVDLSWTDGSGGLQYDYEYVIQAPGTGEPTTNGAQIGDVTVVDEGFDIDGDPLTPNTLYEVYVRADCGGSFSTWTGPITFRTLCDAITTLPHAESFDEVANPSCWSTALITGTTNWAPDDSSDGVPSARTGARFAGKSWAGNDDALLISPAYDLSAYPTDQVRLNVWIYRSDNGLATDKVTFYANTQNNLTGANMLVDVPLPITAAPTVASAGWYNYTVDLPLSYNTGGIFYIIAQGRTTSPLSSYSVGFDDYVLELTPTAPPSCATNVIATPDANCGNFANLITWDATSGAEGYTINVGTTPGGTDIANAVSLTSATYSFTGTINTTYYYTVTPYNANGSATGCTEQSFTTNANGCYCASNPTSNDASGITNVQVGTTNFPTGDVTYFDHSATTVDLARGVTSNVQVTFATGYTYNTNIWIDFDNDFTFEASELVYQGESTGTNPTTLNASFIMPAGAPLGLHKMRIGTADSGQATPNPCYSGSFGVTLDFTINVVAPSCAPPVATTSVVYDCTNSQFSIDVNVTDLGNGSPVISDGTSTWPVTATGTQNVGPFAFGTPVTLTILHGTDASCNLPLGTFNYGGCPPVNDDCSNATVLTPGGVFGDNDVVGTNEFSSASTGAPAPGCTLYSGGDVWYQVAVPASGSITIETNSNSSSVTDTGMAVYSGTCNTLVEIECDDDDSSDGYFSSISLTGRTPGEVLYFRVWEYGNDVFGTFKVSAYDASLSSGSFDNNSFVAYPNPVKDIFNVSYSSEISAVRVLNLLGQEVISQEVNTTSTQIDMSQLSTGTYIVNVTVGDAIKVIKVVKQ